MVTAEEEMVFRFILMLVLRKWLLMMCFGQEVVKVASEALKQ